MQSELTVAVRSLPLGLAGVIVHKVSMNMHDHPINQIEILAHELPQQKHSKYLHSLGLWIYLLSPLRLRIYLSHHFVIDAANVLCKFAGTFVSVA